MRFPDTPRVRYQKNPLVEVICQLRFSKILRIDKEPPSEVQDAIRDEYPDLVIGPAVEVAMPVAGGASPIAISRGQSYEFQNNREKYKLVLTSDFIALAATDYSTWEVFRDKLIRAIEIITPKYGINTFTRVGLRYQDVILRSDLGLIGHKWGNLLSPKFAGPLAADVFNEEDVQEALSVLTITLDDNAGTCRVRHGLARKGDNKELGYLIDADFFKEGPLEVTNVRGTLEDFNREAGRFFRWCISPTLSGAMEPQRIEQ